MRIGELKASYEMLGPLYPVLVDRSRDVIDGKHRKKVDPKWEEKVVPTDELSKVRKIDEEAIKAIIGLVANVNRREIPREEIEKRLGKIKKLTGWSAERIGNEIGRSTQWVLDHLPQKYKEPKKVKAGKKSGDKRGKAKKLSDKSAVKGSLTEETSEEINSETGEREQADSTISSATEDISNRHENEGEQSDFGNGEKIDGATQSIGEIEGNGVINSDYEKWKKEEEEFKETYENGEVYCKYCYQNTHLQPGDGVWECEHCGAGLCPFEIPLNEYPFEAPHPDTNEEIEEADSYLLDYLEDPQFLENVWISDGKRGYGENIYGDPDFRGNTPPIIIFQCLMKYTKEGDKLLDPMAGSGTVIDICKELNREVIGFDIRPMRDDIGYGDASDIKLSDESVDFIFCHFPYWNMIKYSDDKDDLSNLSLQDYLSKVRKIFCEFKRVLKSGGYCAVLIGDKRKSGLIDLSANLSSIGSESLRLHDKIIWVAKKQRSKEGRQSNLTKYRAKKFNYHIQTFDTLLIYKK